jgi:hypothetical protein
MQELLLLDGHRGSSREADLVALAANHDFVRCRILLGAVDLLEQFGSFVGVLDEIFDPFAD